MVNSSAKRGTTRWVTILPFCSTDMKNIFSHQTVVTALVKRRVSSSPFYLWKSKVSPFDIHRQKFRPTATTNGQKIFETGKSCKRSMFHWYCIYYPLKVSIKQIFNLGLGAFPRIVYDHWLDNSQSNQPFWQGEEGGREVKIDKSKWVKFSYKTFIGLVPIVTIQCECKMGCNSNVCKSLYVF